VACSHARHQWLGIRQQGPRGPPVQPARIDYGDGTAVAQRSPPRSKVMSELSPGNWILPLSLPSFCTRAS
jgi:hypothetical protein